MSGVRLLIGTQKGAFIATSGGARRDWAINGPLFGGWEMYHLAGSPADPNRLYRAKQSSSWFGQIIQRSDDGGASWYPVGNEFVYSGATGTHQWYDGTPHPWGVRGEGLAPPRAVGNLTRTYGLRRRRGRGALSSASFDGGQGAGARWTASERMQPGPIGNPAPVACACTHSSSTPSIRSGCSLPSLQPAPSALTTAAPRGSRSTRAFTPKASPISRRKSVIASTGSPNTRSVHRPSSCRSTGDVMRTQMTPGSRGAK